MAVVIADAGPLIALAKINQLNLLHCLFSTVLMTEAVAEECLRRPSTDTERITYALQAGWLQHINNPTPKYPLSRSLGLGEQTIIEYALQADGKTLLIMDDALARKQAIHLHLSLIGTAAVLFMAQRQGLIANAEHLITELNQVGYRISAQVVEQLKQQF
jgi:predicted nucleic acid-binding protein